MKDALYLKRRRKNHHNCYLLKKKLRRCRWERGLPRDTEGGRKASVRLALCNSTRITLKTLVRLFGRATSKKKLNLLSDLGK